LEQGVNSGVGRVHYLPHHEVIRLDKETPKLRVVYNASARKGRTMPPLMTACMQVHHCSFTCMQVRHLFIYDILLSFRIYKIVIILDIENTFLNV